MEPNDHERENLRTKFEAVAAIERSTTQLRFQTLSLFLAAVGLIVGFGHQSRAIGALLLVISIGLWILDLRNRDLLWTFRNIGMKLEERMNEINGGSDGVFLDNPPGQLKEARFGLFIWQDAIRAQLAGLIAYQ
jgi:hypothetical protein